MKSNVHVLYQGAIDTMEATNVFAEQGNDGVIYQLWHCKGTGKKEWRRLPTISQAMELYECDVIREFAD